MKLRKEFITHHSGDSSHLIPTGGAGFAGLVQGNKTLGAILELLKTDTTEDKIIAAMCARFDAPEAVIAADVQKAIAGLRKIEALDE